MSSLTDPLFALALALFALPTPAHAQEAGGLVVSQPWARATPPGASVGGGYATIRNTGPEPDRLVGFASPLAERGEVHEMSVESGIMRMRPMPVVEVKPGESLVLKPGGLHLMFMELRAPLRQGEPVKGVLRFERAGPIEVEFGVARPGAPGPEDGAASAAAQPAPAGHDHKH